MYKLLTGFLLALFIVTAPVLAEPASKKSVEKLMEKTGAADLGIQLMGQMIPAIKKVIPQAPEEFWDEVMTEMDAGQIIDLVVPVYQKHLTEEDVQDIIAFYETPAGKKLVRVQPVISKESFEIGQQWGQSVAKKIIEKYKNSSD